MLYQTKITVSCDEDNYQTNFGVRAISRKHAINKAIKIVETWLSPKQDQIVSIEVELLEEK